MTASRIVIATFVGLWSVSAFAQIPATNNPNSPDQQGQTAAPNSGAPPNGTNAQGNPNDPNASKDPNAPKDRNTPNNDALTPETGKGPLSGPDIIDDANATPEQKASSEYSGPAVLSRGISSSEPMNPQNTRFLPSVGVQYVYNSGLTGVAIQPNGSLSNSTESGIQLNYSLTGQKVYKRDIFSLSFGGNYYSYFPQSTYNGSNDTLGLTWTHKMSRHLTFGVRVSAQEYNQNNLQVSGANYINTGVGTTLLTSPPATEVFDGRVFSFFTEGDVTYQMNSRVSINLSGGGFMTRRSSSALYGDTGYQAGADLAYRLTRHVTTGVYYSYTYFDFIGTYGASDINTLGVTYSISFNPSTQLMTRVGASRLESTGLNSVALSPVLALLLGSGSTLQAVYQINYTPDVNVQLRRKVSTWALSLGYGRGVTPGNGVILTSIRQDATLGADRKLGRYWNFSTTGGYDTLSGYGTTNAKYASVFLNGSITRTLIRNLAWNARLDYHYYTFDNTGFLRNNYMISSGVVWSPGNLLERVW